MCLESAWKVVSKGMACELESMGVKSRWPQTLWSFQPCFSGLHSEVEKISLECHKP